MMTPSRTQSALRWYFSSWSASRDCTTVRRVTSAIGGQHDPRDEISARTHYGSTPNPGDKHAAIFTDAASANG
jgi:hypothetical protein